ncbi:unnamed protein product [Albugo candida]|uniref:Uncharacterized protein n=1 Tax=Albugo candida TaxID=65357 RepID=A0A024GAH0_9STRA|nr:unnamed protein product [Albugo candida]|eukprot:CCI43317.1 unnamed protein product [Albugo candida]
MSVHVKNLPSRYGVCTSIEQKASYERWNASLPLSWLFLCTLKDNECAKCADSFRGNQNQELFHLIIPVSLNLACVATKNLTCYFDKPDQGTNTECIVCLTSMRQVLHISVMKRSVWVCQSERHQNVFTKCSTVRRFHIISILALAYIRHNAGMDM